MRLVYLDPHSLNHVLPALMQIIQTVDALAAAGARIELVVPEAESRLAVKAVLGRDFHPGVHVVELQDFSRRWWFPFHSNRPFFWQARRYLKRHKRDALLVRNLKLAGRLLREGTTTPLFFETHEIFAQSYLDATPVNTRQKQRKYAALCQLENQVYRESKGVIAITAALADDVRSQNLASQTICIAPDGVDLAAAHAARSRHPSLISDPPNLLYLGSLHQWKGVETLIAAMVDVPIGILNIAGGETHRVDALRELAHKRGVADRVKFLGKIPPAQRFDTIAAATMCLLPLTHQSIASRYTSPLKLFEYMAMGKPIIAGDLPSIREVLSHEVNALLVPPEDRVMLAQAINRLHDDQALATQIAAAAERDALRYSWEARARTITDFIQARLRHVL